MTRLTVQQATQQIQDLANDTIDFGYEFQEAIRNILMQCKKTDIEHVASEIFDSYCWVSKSTTKAERAEWYARQIASYCKRQEEKKLFSHLELGEKIEMLQNADKNTRAKYLHACTNEELQIIAEMYNFGVSESYVEVNRTYMIGFVADEMKTEDEIKAIEDIDLSEGATENTAKTVIRTLEKTGGKALIRFYIKHDFENYGAETDEHRREKIFIYLMDKAAGKPSIEYYVEHIRNMEDKTHESIKNFLSQITRTEMISVYQNIMGLKPSPAQHDIWAYGDIEQTADDIANYLKDRLFVESVNEATSAEQILDFVTDANKLEAIRINCLFLHCTPNHWKKIAAMKFIPTSEWGSDLRKMVRGLWDFIVSETANRAIRETTAQVSEDENVPEFDEVCYVPEYQENNAVLEDCETVQ